MQTLFISLLSLLLLLSFTSTTALYTFPLHASGHHILDATNATVQFRCANWPGHMETMLPEGLQWQPLDAIVDLLAKPDTFNCIRLTYSVDLFYLGVNMTARQSFARLGLNSSIAQFEAANPALIDLTLLAVRDAVVLACAKKNIFILFDNQVSHSEWCCSTTDGNGWYCTRHHSPTPTSPPLLSQTLMCPLTFLCPFSVC